MDYTAEIKIKSKSSEKLKQILEVDKDYREDSCTKYAVNEEKLVIQVECANLTSLKKSINDSMKKLTLIEETIQMIEENK